MGLIYRKDNVALISFCNSEENIEVDKTKDFAYIYSNNKIVGLNVFNIEKYFRNIKEGFSTINDDFKEQIENLHNPRLIHIDYYDFYKVGLIKSIEKHPKSEKLVILNIDSDKNYKIVTNKIDLKPNTKIVFATENSYLTDGNKITKTKVLGIESEGMVLSYKSLKLNDSEELIQTNLEKGSTFHF